MPPSLWYLSLQLKQTTTWSLADPVASGLHLGMTTIHKPTVMELPSHSMGEGRGLSCQLPVPEKFSASQAPSGSLLGRWRGDSHHDPVLGSYLIDEPNLVGVGKRGENVPCLFSSLFSHSAASFLFSQVTKENSQGLRLLQPALIPGTTALGPSQHTDHLSHWRPQKGAAVCCSISEVRERIQYMLLEERSGRNLTPYSTFATDGRAGWDP